VIVGDGSTGKTCLLTQYTNQTISHEYIPTIFDNYSVNVMYDGEIIKLSLWDTAGQEDYDTIRKMSYSDTHVIILCFSLISPTSYDNILSKWIPELIKNCPTASIILVGTKLDLRQGRLKEISYSKGLELCRKINAYSYIESSSITGYGVKRVFDDAILSYMSSQNKPTKEKSCFIL
jgi:Ras-related C3 botulinum toxin substrate 1